MNCLYICKKIPFTLFVTFQLLKGKENVISLFDIPNYTAPKGELQA